jgi:hypothetical protein
VGVDLDRVEQRDSTQADPADFGGGTPIRPRDERPVRLQPLDDCEITLVADISDNELVERSKRRRLHDVEPDQSHPQLDGQARGQMPGTEAECSRDQPSGPFPALSSGRKRFLSRQSTITCS